MNLRYMLVSGQYQAALSEFGEDEVRSEIDDMIYDDFADKALAAAKALGYADLERTAATVVRNSGAYGW